ALPDGAGGARRRLRRAAGAPERAPATGPSGTWPGGHTWPERGPGAAPLVRSAAVEDGWPLLQERPGRLPGVLGAAAADVALGLAVELRREAHVQGVVEVGLDRPDGEGGEACHPLGSRADECHQLVVREDR